MRSSTSSSTTLPFLNPNQNLFLILCDQVQPAQADAEPTQSCAKQVTTADCFTVWDFVWRCGALDGDSLECTMRYDDLPGDRQARQAKQKDKARAALLEEAKVEDNAPALAIEEWKQLESEKV